MSKKWIAALVLILLCVVVLLKNSGSVSVDLLVHEVKAGKSFVFPGFIASGILIGMLFK